MSVSTPKYVYICASGYSGSTLLDLILGSHPRAFSLGELTHLPKNLSLNSRCSCGAPIRSCRFWSGVLERLGNGRTLGADPYALNLGYMRASALVDRRRQTRLYLAKRKLLRGLAYAGLSAGSSGNALAWRILGPRIAERQALYAAIRAESGAPMLVDSSKCYLTGIGLYKSEPEAVRVVLLTRDGRGCMYSNLKRAVPVRRAARAWARYYSRAWPLLRTHVAPRHLYHARYERLVEDPQREIAALCQFLGLPFEQRMLDYAEAEHHVANGNDMRFVQGSVIKGDFTWRKAMSPGARAYFEKRAGALNRRLGYE